MAPYLLDSDAVIDFLKQIRTSTAIIAGLQAQGDSLCTCDVILTEVFAALHPQDEREALPFLQSFLYLQTSRLAAEQAGRWRYTFARRGLGLSAYDMLVAGTAWQHNATIVTGNVRHFPMPEVSVLALPR